MKKLLLVLAIGAFAACNDAGTGEGEKKDSTANTTATPPAHDSTAVKDTTAHHADSTAAKVDTTKK